MRSLGALVVAASIAAAAQGVPTPAAAATVASAPAASAGRLGIQLLDAPVSAKNDPRAHIYIVDQLRSGASITRHVRVTNFSTSVAAVSVYAAAASVSGGQFRFAAGRTPNDLTSWTSVTPSSARLAAGAATEATVQITVPKHVSTGERYAVVWAEVSSPAVAGSARETNRVGVRIYLDIAGNVQRSDFAITTVSAARNKAGQPVVTAKVHNTGERAVDITGTVGLSNGPGGLSTGPSPTDATVTIAPGDTQSVSAHFDARIQAGPWRVTVKLVSGTLHRQAVATVRFPDAAAVPVVVSVNRGHHATGWMWWLVGSGLVLLALLAFVLLVWLIRRRQRRAAEPAIAI